MPVNLSIKDVPDLLADRLRARAARNHRSLQGELMSIIEQAAHEATAPGPDATGAALPGVRRSWTQGCKTVDQLVADRRASGWAPHASLARAPLGADIVRADRDSR